MIWLLFILIILGFFTLIKGLKTFVSVLKCFYDCFNVLIVVDYVYSKLISLMKVFLCFNLFGVVLERIILGQEREGKTLPTSRARKSSIGFLLRI